MKKSKTLKQKIKLIKEQVALEIFDLKCEYDTDLSNDLKAESIYNDFEIELLEWSKDASKDKYSVYGDYLINKYLATNLDSYKTTRRIKEIRKTILKIIDKYLQN